MADDDKQISQQPSKVSESDLPRPPDNSVVTDDFDFFQQQTATSKPSEKKPDSDGDTPQGDAAAEDDKSTGSNDQNSASGDDNKQQTGDDDGKPARKQRGNYRYKKLQRAFNAEQNRSKNLEAKVAQLQQTVSTLESKIGSGSPSDASEKAPQLKEFDTPEEYAREFAAYEARKAEREKSEKPKQPSRKPTSPQSQSHPNDTRQATDDEIEAFTNRGKKAFGDEFMEALQAPIKVNQLMGEFMFDSEHGPAIYVHLSNNPEEAEQLYTSSPRRTERLLEALEKRAVKGDLDIPEDGELQIDDGKPGDDKQAQNKGKQQKGDGTGKKGTTAPDPPENSNDGGNYSLDPDLENMDMDDYAATRMKQEANKRRRNIAN